MHKDKTPESDTVQTDPQYGLIDLKTGEITGIPVYQAKEGRWDKAWAKSLADLMELTGESRTKVIAYLLRKKNTQNVIHAPMRVVAEETGVSVKTVNRTIKQMVESNFLIRLGQGVVMFSPHVIRPGPQPQGMAVLRRWNEAKEQDS